MVIDSCTLSSNIVFIHAVPCRSTTHVKLRIPQITAIADFKQRWQQRGKTVGSSFNCGASVVKWTNINTENCAKITTLLLK